MRIALFRPLDAASLLAAVPALRALDAALPQAPITLIAPPELREIGARLARYLDAFLEFPGFPGIPGECQLDAVPGFFERAKRERFDLAIQMHGAGEIVNPLMVLMGAEHNAGFYRPGRYCPDPQRYLEWRESEDEVERWLRLAIHLGAASRGAFLEFPLLAEDWAEWRALRLRHYVCLHCTGQAQHFAELGDALAAEGWNVVLTGPVRVAAAMRQPAVDLAGRVSLGAAAALIAKAGLLVAADRTVTRIGAAMRTPVVIPQADSRQTLRAARELLARAA
ncbi:MAG: glycosyltransferase family 9 protein [Burkholderiales bacterium]